MSDYRIAVYPGDGIGLEVTEEAVKVIKAVERRFGLSFHLDEFDWGNRYWRRKGHVVPSDFLDTLRGYDAILLGALGYPAVLPDHVTLEPLIKLRQSFDQYACLRPATLLPGVESPLRGREPGDIDMVVVRENSEGEYIDAGGRMHVGEHQEIAVQTGIHSRRGIERILRYAFGLARDRKKRLALATKSNAWRYAMVLWDVVLEEVRGDYPEVAVEKYHVDALTMHFVRMPGRFDVVVASNLFGDILSDLSGAITGSIGLAPSANVNPERTYPSLFEPVHGSAPDIAGRGIANPIAAIRSVAMMLDFLGEREASECIDRVVRANLAAGHPRTPDLGGGSSTAEVGDDVVERIEDR